MVASKTAVNKPAAKKPTQKATAASSPPERGTEHRAGGAAPRRDEKAAERTETAETETADASTARTKTKTKQTAKKTTPAPAKPGTKKKAAPARKPAAQEHTGKADHPAEGSRAAREEGATGAAAGQPEASGRAGARKAPTRQGTGKVRSPAKTPNLGEESARRAPAGKGAAGAAGAKSEKTVKTTKRAARQTGAKKVAAKKSTADRSATAVPPARAAAPAAPGDLAVRSGEEPWTEEEVTEALAGLLDEAGRLRAEISAAEKALSGLMRDSGDGAGDDQADTGTKNVTREHEMALATNAREVLYQTERALRGLEAGTYGLCENCGNPIGKARMQAFPRATLCVDCKQKQERRF
jgi:DnaK suppressor protein